VRAAAPFDRTLKILEIALPMKTGRKLDGIENTVLVSSKEHRRKGRKRKGRKSNFNSGANSNCCNDFSADVAL
jgi:hypothetical protein